MSKTFQFQNGFDYYELWESMMGSTELEEIMEDSEDYEEFYELLKSGKFQPF